MMTDQRLEPHNLEAEQAVLGACLVDRDVIVHIAPTLAPEDFHRPAHRLIYRAIRDLYLRRVPADLVSMVEELTGRGELGAAGGESYLAELIAATPTSVHAGYYRDIVAEHAQRRRLIDAAREIVQAGYDTSLSVPDAIAQAEAVLTSATRGMASREVEALGDVVERYLARMDDGPARLTSFGYPKLDQIIGGMEDGDLTIIAARPSMGKTAFALGTAMHNAGKRGRTVAFVSLEMSAEKLLHRALSHQTGLDNRKIGFRGLSLNEHERWMVEEAGKALMDWPLHIDATGNGRIEQVLARVRSLHAEYGLDLLIIDGLWLLEWAGAKGNRVQEVGKISRMLKLLALELEIPIIALHQLNRASLHREDKIPVLSDLRESGDVEQDADLVVFIHRPHLLDPAQPKHLANIILAKHRQGPIGRVNMYFDERATRFYDSRSPLEAVS